MRVRWTEALAVGVAAIDEQHRQLIDLLNMLLEAAEGGDVDATRQAALKFRDLALRHLDDEETMFPAGYSAASAQRHYKSHDEARELINRLSDSAWKDGVDIEAVRKQVPAVVMELFSNDAGLARSMRA